MTIILPHHLTITIFSERCHINNLLFLKNYAYNYPLKLNEYHDYSAPSLKLIVKRWFISLTGTPLRVAGR